MSRPSKWSPEFREEAVRLQRESGESITAVAKRLGLSPETLRNWVRRDEIERGEREGLTIAELNPCSSTTLTVPACPSTADSGLSDPVLAADLDDRAVAAQRRHHDLKLLLRRELPVLALLAQPDLLRWSSGPS